MSLCKRFRPRLESFEDRTLLSAALPLLTASPTMDRIQRILPESADASSPSVLVHAEPGRESTMLVARFTHVPAATVVLVLGGPSQPLDDDGTARWSMPRKAQSAVLAIQTASRTNVPVLRVDFDDHGRIVRQVALTDLRLALPPRFGMQATMPDGMAAMPMTRADGMAAMQDGGGRSMPAMTGHLSAMAGVNRMPLGHEDQAMMRSGGMAMGGGPMSGHAATAAVRDHGEPGAEPMQDDHAADLFGEPAPLLAGGEPRVHAMGPSEEVASAALAGAFTNPAGSGFAGPVEAPPAVLRDPLLDPSAERDPAAPAPQTQTGETRRSRTWEAAVAGAVAVVAFRGAYVLERHAQGTGSDVFSWLKQTTGSRRGPLRLVRGRAPLLSPDGKG
jgi:hypothetical protein